MEILPWLTAYIVEQHDVDQKGTIEIDDLTASINALTEDNLNLRQHLNGFMQLLEFKNEHKVYYTPFSLSNQTLIRPYFKYLRRINQQKVIESIHRRLSSCDDEDNGFINKNHFKTILEQELKIKEKIVQDFISNICQNSLDFNLNHHSMMLKIDFLLLIWKLLTSIKQDAVVSNTVMHKELTALDIAQMKAT